jgi:putative spermidine/putrescine transport system substrate-binding protein
MAFRTLARVGLIAAAVCTMTYAHARDFTWASWGGTLQVAQRNVYLDEFKKTYTKPIAEDVYLGKWAKFQTMADTGNVDWDLVDVESNDVFRGCEEGTFKKLDYQRLGLKRSDYIDGAAQDCGLGAYVFAFALVYNTDRIKNAPTTTADFWNLQKWPGRRALRKGPRYNLEFALLSDGVPAKDIYKTLGTKAGVQRAFKRLDTIKSQVVWWDGAATVPGLVASGSVAMAIAPHGRIAAARASGQPLAMVFAPGLIGIDYWVIPKGAAHENASYQLLKLLGNDRMQAKFTAAFPYSPTSKNAISMLDPKEAAELPVGKNTEGSLLMASPEAIRFWADNGDALNEEWNNWLAR